MFQSLLPFLVTLPVSLFFFNDGPFAVGGNAPSYPTFLSIPLIPPNYDVKSIHGPVIQQQHINRALKRLALMTGQSPPSDYELLSAIYERITRLSNVDQRDYDIEKLAEQLKAYSSSGEPTLTPTQKDPLSFLVSRTTGASSLPRIGLDIDSNDYGYIGNVKMGTPARNFRLLVDTGSSDLWVGAEGCRGNDGGDCGNHTFLGSNSSKTFNISQEDWAIGYVSGTVSGFLARDDISIAGLMLKAHQFGVALNESKDFTSDDIPFDGLLGLGKESISQQRIPTVVQSLFQAGLIPAPIVSFKLPRLADGYNDGELALGAMNPKHYYANTLVQMKNINKFGYWGVAVDAVYVGKQNMKFLNRMIVLDSGTPLIIAPEPDVDAIHAHIPGAQSDGSNWTVPCNMTTVLSLTVGGQSFSIQPRDIAFYPVSTGSDRCMSGIAVGGVGPFYLDTDWLVGDVFLKNVYFSTNEQKDQISLAKSRA